MEKKIKKLIKDFDTLSETEQIKASVLLIAGDFYLFTEKNLQIKDKRGMIIPLVPNDAQKMLLEQVIEDILVGRPSRYIILKARQMGFSTIIEALAYWWTATHRNIVTVIAAHEKPASRNLYKMFQRYYDYSDAMFKPTRKYSTKYDLTFATGEDDNPGLESEIKTMVAEGAAGRSDTIHFLHGSEVAFWRDGEEVLSGMQQAVPLLSETFIFLESTANGVGGYFYEEWQAAKKGESAFTPIFYAWWMHGEYETPATKSSLSVLTKEEKYILSTLKKKGLTKASIYRKIAWRRLKLTEFRSNPDKFMQEYPFDDIEAFLASGRPVFNIRNLIKMEEDAIDPDYYNVTLTPKKKLLASKTDFSPLKVWKLPEEGRRYVIGADVAEGIQDDTKDSDWSVADVIDAETMETVARWRGHIDPDQFGEHLVELGTWYNYALLGVESNNHGLTTLTAVRNRFYRNLYVREKGLDTWFETPTGQLGWRTDKKTKPVMIDDLAQAIRESAIIEHDVTAIRELMTYVRDDQGRTNATLGTHDDTVIAKAIALQMFKWQYIDKTLIKSHKPAAFVAAKRGKR